MLNLKKSTLLLFFSVFHTRQIPANPFEQALVVEDRVILEINDAGEEVSLSLEQHEQFLGHSYLFHRASFYDFKKSFEEVSTYLTSTLEEAYDVFILVNVQSEKSRHFRNYVPSQSMRVLRKSQGDQRVFKRDRQGVIVGIHPEILGRGDRGAFEGLQGLIPVSSGAGHLPVDTKGRHFVDTPTGIYRINTDKSVKRRFQEHIYHGLYFDLIYPSGGESGLAIHGTNQRNYPLLGTQSSRGCIRTTQHTAYILYENLMSEEFRVQDLPDMDQYKRLKPELRDENGRIQRRAGPSALFIIFHGYENKPTITSA